MTMPSPFEMGRAVGGNVSSGLEEGREKNAISQVLGQIASEKDPVAAQNKMNQLLLNIAPERRDIAQQLIGQQIGQLQQQKIQQTHEAMAKSFINDFPDSPEMQAAARVLMSDLPADQKPALMKAMAANLPYKQEQQKRLERESIRKVYDGRIKQLQEQKKNARFNERPMIEEQIKMLQDQEDTALGVLHMKSKFDPANEVHMKRFEELDKKYKGDKAKVNAEMAKEFQ
jgi:hypothetical protein